MVGIPALTSQSALPELGMRPAIGATQAGEAHAASGSDFSSILKSFTTEATDTLRQGEAAAIDGIQGQLPLQTVVEQVMAAERTLQASLAVRDKLVTSYLEISRMQI
jgi:flagellar hook-basal body complex protein FliE